MQSAFRMEKEDKKAAAEGPEDEEYDESVNLNLTESEAEEPNPMEGTSSAAPAAALGMSPAALAESDNEDVIDRDTIQWKMIIHLIEILFTNDSVEPKKRNKLNLLLNPSVNIFLLNCFPAW